MEIRVLFPRLLLLVTLSSFSVIPYCHSFILQPTTFQKQRTQFRSSYPTATFGTLDDKAEEYDENASLLNKASELRREAMELEATLRSSQNNNNDEKMNKEKVEVIPRYQSIEGSTWTLTYGFSSEPPPKDDTEEPKTPVQSYRGKVSVTFRPDGYTDLVLQEGVGKDRADIVKVWGWDEEISREDGKKYVLFSMDAKFPGEAKPERVYLQARVEEENGFVELQEGTVTMKREYLEKSFGFFSAKGILAQFRKVGDFVSKPTSI